MPISFKEAVKIIDREGYVVMDGMRIYVIAKDLKQAYGNTLVLINPIAGEGEKWVNINRFFIFDGAGQRA